MNRNFIHSILDLEKYERQDPLILRSVSSTKEKGYIYLQEDIPVQQLCLVLHPSLREIPPPMLVTFFKGIFARLFNVVFVDLGKIIEL